MAAYRKVERSSISEPLSTFVLAGRRLHVIEEEQRTREVTDGYGK